MFDIVILVLIPLTIGIVAAVYKAHKSNAIFKSKRMADKIHVVSHQSTAIYDYNHKKSILSLLMVQENDETFLKACAGLLSDNISDII